MFCRFSETFTLSFDHIGLHRALCIANYSTYPEVNIGHSWSDFHAAHTLGGFCHSIYLQH